MAEIVEDARLRDRRYVFEDRAHAGALLASMLQAYIGKPETWVLAIPAGGVPVAVVVAQKLKAPLDLAVTRKLHVPWNREAGFGAVAWDGTTVLNEPLVASLGLSSEEIARCLRDEQAVIRQRVKRFRGDRPFPDLTAKTVILVDDGVASGFSMFTTLKTIASLGAKERIVAVPTASRRGITFLQPAAEQIMCLNIRSGPIFAVADAYQVWYDLTDEEVMRMLQRVEGRQPADASSPR